VALVQACQDEIALARWHRRAVTVPSVDGVFAG